VVGSIDTHGGRDGFSAKRTKIGNLEEEQLFNSTLH
jgi:hypothetical protein